MTWQRRIAWCLGLGVLTTVLVAWVANQGWLRGFDRTIRSEARAMDAPNYGPDRTGLYEIEFTDSRGLTVWRTWAGYRRVPLRDHLPTVTRPNEIAPRWMLEMARARADWRDAPTGVALWHLQAGWPWRALQWHSFMDSSVGGESISGAVILLSPGKGGKSATQSLPGGVIALPWEPVWAGLIADIVAFATAWWLVFVGLAALRRRRRRARGRCAACGYALKGLAPDTPCPECGKASVPVSMSTA